MLVPRILWLIAAIASHASPLVRAAEQAVPNADAVINEYYDNFRRQSDERLQSELIIMWFSTAGGGDFDLKERIGGECVRVAKAAADTWLDLQTLDDAVPLIEDGLRDAAADIRNTNTSGSNGQKKLPHPMEKVCAHLEQNMQRNPVVNTKFLRYQRQPKSTPPEFAKNVKATIGRPSNNYVNAYYATLFGEPRIGHMIGHGAFVTHLKTPNCTPNYRLSKTILELSKRDDIGAAVQYQYDKGLHDTVQFVLEILERDKNRGPVAAFQIVNDSVLARIKQNLEKDPKLRPHFESTQKLVDSTCKVSS